MRKNNLKSWLFAGTGLLMGVWIAFQLNAVNETNRIYNRESSLNIFKEIQIVKTSNRDLNEILVELEREFANTNDREKALEGLKSEISKYEKISGIEALTGNGVEIRINKNVPALWLTDLVNDLFTAGAEAISINGIRFSSIYQGFDRMPNGQLLFGGEILKEPYTIKAIGQAEAISESLNEKEGFVERLKQSIKDIGVEVIARDKITVEAIATTAAEARKAISK